MVTRRGVLLGTAAATAVSALGVPAVSALGVPAVSALGVAPAAAASPPRQARPRAVFGMPLPGGLVCPVQYLSRAAWGADESYRYYPGHEDWPIEPNLPQTITVHHTGFAVSADPAETVRTIYRQQALPASMGGIQGWGDIGYHLLIDADGVVYEGRYSGSDQWPVFDPTGWYVVTGAHVYGYNTGNIGVCLLGYLNDAPPTQAAQDALVTVLAYLAQAAGIDPLATVNYHNPINGNRRTVRAISGHRDWDATDCPGHALYPLLAGIRQRVGSSMPSAPQPTQTETQPPTAEPTSTGPTTSEPSTPGSGGGEPTTTATGEPTGTPEQTTAPAPTASQTTTQRPAPPPPPPPPPGGGRERGGDEYVQQARVERPEEFPTVAPSPTPTATPTVDGAAGVPTPRRGPTTSGAVSAEVESAGPAWGLAAMTVGVTAVGALGTVGAWWLRRRRAVAAAEAGRPGLTVVEEPVAVPADEPDTPEPSPTAGEPTEPKASPDTATTEPDARPDPENSTGSSPSDGRPD